jgi:hypothetical protein
MKRMRNNIILFNCFFNPAMPYNKLKDATIGLLGVTGLVCSTACALQQLLMSKHYLLSVSAVLIYGTGFAGYFLFMKMKKISILLICISALLMFIEQALLFSLGSVLWLSFLVMLFSIIVVAVIYIQRLKTYMAEIENNHPADHRNY